MDGNQYYSQVYALTSDHKVYSWGLNSEGQLGIGTGEGGVLENHTTPQLVTFATLSDGEYIEDINADGFSLRCVFALTNKGKLYAWGLR